MLDEHLHGARTIAALSSWYRGRVISVTALRPHSVIKDDAIPMLLREVRQPGRVVRVTQHMAEFYGSDGRVQTLKFPA